MAPKRSPPAPSGDIHATEEMRCRQIRWRQKVSARPVGLPSVGLRAQEFEIRRVTKHNEAVDQDRQAYRAVRVAQHFDSGHQLLLPPADWCPVFVVWTTQAFHLIDTDGDGLVEPVRPRGTKEIACR